MSVCVCAIHVIRYKMCIIVTEIIEPTKNEKKFRSQIILINLRLYTGIQTDN